MNFFVTGIDTDSGKTLVSAILCEALQADYWKPIQAGLPRDTDLVKSLITNTTTKFHKEAYLLKTPASPHASAKIDNITIAINALHIPSTNNKLIVEGAGGCLVPIDDNDFVIDIATLNHLKVILVADLYLGSINHTLLTVQELKRRQLDVVGIIFNGESNYESEQIILKHSGWKKLLHINREPIVNKDVVKSYATLLLKNWNG